MSARRTIVALGGVEFTREPVDAAIHDHIVGLAGQERPRICHLPTASGDPREQIAAFHSVMEARGVEASVVSVFRLGETEVDVRSHLLSQDVIYVGGGSMVNLIALWREHGIDQVMRDAYAAGVILCGYSAGSMCWFEAGVSRGSGAPERCEGLGLVAGSHCVHYSEDPGRRTAYLELVGAGELGAGLALDDHCAAHFEGGELVEVVRARETANGYRVEPGQGDREPAVETQLDSRLIRASHDPPDTVLDELRQLRRARGSRG